MGSIYHILFTLYAVNIDIIEGLKDGFMKPKLVAQFNIFIQIINELCLTKKSKIYYLLI